MKNENLKCRLILEEIVVIFDDFKFLFLFLAEICQIRKQGICDKLFPFQNIFRKLQKFTTKEINLSNSG
jgi:hypothetical protein